MKEERKTHTLTQYYALIKHYNFDEQQRKETEQVMNRIENAHAPDARSDCSHQ